MRADTQVTYVLGAQMTSIENNSTKSILWRYYMWKTFISQRMLTDSLYPPFFHIKGLFYVSQLWWHGNIEKLLL